MLNSSKIISDSGVAFGTSGARGLVTQFTPDVCAAFTAAFVSVLKENFNFSKFALAIDNRPSSCEMAQSCAHVLIQHGIEVEYYGVVPTPALAFCAMQQNIPSIMITGSHIPFDRNGIKFYRPDGEISKQDEAAILSQSVSFEPLTDLPELTLDNKAKEQYATRYVSLFSNTFLKGQKIGIYEHSSAGRDIYSNVFESLGAEVVSLGRSDQFVPIDTEAVALEDIQKGLDWSKQHGFNMIFSTDGDGDRPLIADENGHWLRGDVLGLLCAKALNADAIATPVSCNTAIEKSGAFNKVIRTKIGSPHVIAAFDNLNQQYQRIAGFEANGGFLLGSDVEVNGQVVHALPTRDALLPALMLLSLCNGNTISSQVNGLPERYTHSDRIKDFATEKSNAILNNAAKNPQQLIEQLGFKELAVESSDSTDGLRMTLTNGDIVHLRPSGNAPELRCYAESTTVAKAIEIVSLALKNVVSINL